MYTNCNMADYWRPGFQESYKEFLEKFLEEHDEVPFEDPRDFMKFCTDQSIMEIQTSEKQIEKERERIKKELEDTL